MRLNSSLMAGGPRDISVVAYFTDPSEFTGGDLEMVLAGSTATEAEMTSSNVSDVGSNGKRSNDEHIVRRRFCAGDTVAFPSKGLEHRVSPVTDGERRSLLLLCRRRCPETVPFIFTLPASDWAADATAVSASAGAEQHMLGAEQEEGEDEEEPLKPTPVALATGASG